WEGHVTPQGRALLGSLWRWCGGLLRCFSAAPQGILLRTDAGDELLTLMRLGQLVGQLQAVDGILSIQHRTIVFWGNFGGGEFIRQGSATYQEGNVNASSAEVLGSHYHLLGRFDQ